MCPFELRICMQRDLDPKKKMVMSVWPEKPKKNIFYFFLIDIIRIKGRWNDGVALKL